MNIAARATRPTARMGPRTASMPLLPLVSTMEGQA
jgi:hypothetical protein